MTAILGWGFVGKQVRPSVIALLASVSFVLVAVLGVVAALPDGSTVYVEATVSDETTPSDEERARPRMMAVEEYTLGNCASVIGCIVPNTPHPDSELKADALDEYQTLLASLSPGVRASYDGAVLAHEDAQKREHERDEAAYAVFIEEHLRRLKKERPSRK